MRKMVEQQGGQGWQELQSLTGGSVAGGQNLTVVCLGIQRHLGGNLEGGQMANYERSGETHGYLRT